MKGVGVRESSPDTRSIRPPKRAEWTTNLPPGTEGDWYQPLPGGPSDSDVGGLCFDTFHTLVGPLRPDVASVVHSSSLLLFRSWDSRPVYRSCPCRDLQKSRSRQRWELWGFSFLLVLRCHHRVNSSRDERHLLLLNEVFII